MESNVTEIIEEFSNSDLAQCIHNETDSALEKLDIIWDKMGLDTSLREQRAKTILKHVKNLYKCMLEEAEEHRVKLLEDIETLIERLTTLSKELQTNIGLDGYQETPLKTVKNELEEKLQRYQHIYDTRRADTLRYIGHEEKLCLVLGVPPKSLNSSPLPTSEELSDFRIYVEELSTEKFRREELFLKTKSDILDIISELKVQPNLGFEQTIVNGDEADFLVSDENMAHLASYHETLVARLTETRHEVLKLREQLGALWELLEEDPQTRSAFLQTHTGNSVAIMRALKDEIMRCEEKKRDNIKVFIDKIRTDIVTWWELCRYSPAQRAEFKYFASNTFTEDLLSLHELHLDKLKKFYESNKAIFNMINKREELWAQLLDLEKRAEDPERYKNRGGELLREEKQRKSVASRLPKIEQELVALVDEYEQKTGEKFLVSGELVADLISHKWTMHREDKQLKLSAKKQARVNPTITPLKSPLPPSHSRLTPRVTPAKRKIAVPLFGSAKRNKNTTNIPKIQVNGSTLKRASMERKAKMEKRQKSRALRQHNDTISSTTTDYDDFEVKDNASNKAIPASLTNQMALAEKPSCRSTLFTNKGGKQKENIPKTPKRSNLLANNNTPRSVNRSKLRSGSPVAPTSHLSAAPPGNLPIII